MQNLYVEEFKQTGVYEILNLVNGHKYIGSTTMSFTKRLKHHRSMLKGNKHKNIHLQNAWNKYGEENFSFNILKVVDKCCTLDVEQTYLDNLKPEYNINPLASGTPNLSKETIEKRSKSFKQYMSIAMDYYKKVKLGEMELEDVPTKFFKNVESRLSYIVWNTGLDSSKVDYSFLRGVPKTITDRVLKARKHNSEQAREKSPNIFVFDSKGNFLKEFRSAPDIEEWSVTEENNFPIKSRFKNPRMGIPINKLLAICIIKAVNHKTMYKSLYFLTNKEDIYSLVGLPKENLI